MKIDNILVTGDRNMIHRHKFLFQAMSPYVSQIEYLPNNSLFHSKLLKNFIKPFYKSIPFLSANPTSLLRKNAQTFIKQSYQTEQKIRKLSHNPDLIFHIYGMFSPFWDQFDIPYVTYLDYTMARAIKNWLPWAACNTEDALTAWLECERRAYKHAHHLFTKSHCVKSSLINDYGIEPNKITVIYSSGQFLEPYRGEKTFGSKQILFNGSDFERKGGDLLITAFRIVKQAIPEATLVIVGEKLSIHGDGIYNPGYISSARNMMNFFLNTDLVVSPAHCEPLGLFLIEAMNYGIPSIVSNQDGMPEIIEHGYNGFVISQRDPEYLAAQIIELLSNNAVLKEMSRNARYKIKTQLNWNIIAKQISEILINT